MFKKSLVFTILWLGFCGLKAQHHHPEKQITVDESHYDSFADFFQKGEFEIHARSFNMMTFNRGELSDYAAWAAGAGIGYKSPHFKGFAAGMSGFFIFKLHDKNLAHPDPITGGVNRYELTLFDMNDPENGEDLDRLEELYLEYKTGATQFVIGRQYLETPLLNGQDNRMRPNIFSGYWMRSQWKSIHLEGGWIRRVSPRGTVDWYDMDNSLGVYPFGRNIDGNPSQYKGNMKTLGIFVAGGYVQNELWEHKYYNYFAHNLFNVAFGETVRKIAINQSKAIELGAQGFWQTQVGDGGNPDPTKSYIHEGERTFGLGGRVAFRLNEHCFAINSLYIHDSGRFLFPREWGREQFWANLPRERFEGNGGLNALMVSWTSDILKDRMHTFIGVGVTDTQEPSVARLNKNGMPSWYHFAGRFSWTFDQSFQGLKITSMVIYKGQLEGDPVPDALAINRVDMWNFNLIVDYKF
jgi:hypothetical protein